MELEGGYLRAASRQAPTGEAGASHRAPIEGKTDGDENLRAASHQAPTVESGASHRAPTEETIDGFGRGIPP